jgi:predicted ATP-dependent endonuclease of OLD family
MKLVNFSVTNFRSITTAHKIAISNSTVLIGKNNEGKSNILKGLNIAMSILQEHARHNPQPRYINRRYEMNENSYYWERDFPVSFQQRKNGLQTIFKLTFNLNDNDIYTFKEYVKSNINGELIVEIKIGKDNRPKIELLKRGKGGFSQKSREIASFVTDKIIFNYIPAVRTDQEAFEVVQRMLSQQLRKLESQPEYINALEIIKNLQAPILNNLSEEIKKSLVEFLPNITNVHINVPEESRRISLRNNFDIIIDDGTPTNLSFKGDGVKSLAALSLLKNRIAIDGVSIIAIEEPESHLHPAAIHQLNEVIISLSENNQVILTTHNPLFVDRQEIKSNIIVDSGKAKPAKDIKQIREILGIKASDNLLNASFVLVVEGQDDVIALKAILSTLSNELEKHLKNNMLVIEQIGGAGNLAYKLSLLNNSLCVYHTFLDNDKAGRDSFEKAEKENLASVKNNTFVTCNGSPNSELEDCYELEIYRHQIIDEFGVDLNSSKFKNNNKWSDRVKNVFLDQGKLWNEKVESNVKYVVAKAVSQKPKDALNKHKRNSIDALVKTLELMVKS